MERLLDYFVPEKYKLNIGVDKMGKKIGGTVEIIGEALSDTVKFHAVGLEVEQVLVEGEKVDFEVKDGLLTLKKVPRGRANVLVGYNGSLNENMQGAYISTYEYKGETEVIVATQFESHYAREAFPCIDEPAAKAVFELKLTVPEVEGELVLANTPVVGTHKHFKVPDGKYTVFYGEDGKKAASRYMEYEFEPTPRMSTYLLAFVVGRFHGKSITNANGVEITTYCALNQDVDAVDYANEVAAQSLEFYDENFGVKYPLPRLVQVALPDFEAGAMENWGLVTYRETMLLAGKTATLGAKKGVALTVAHELSHQWFGDLVTMKWWDDLWLNESFASVMEYYAVDAIYPEYRIWEGFFTGDALAALRRDCLSGVQSVHQEVHDPAEIATLFDPAIVYAKGARLMLMLIRLMGWEKFCAGIREYFEKFAYENTVGDDLWEVLQGYTEFDVRGMMHAFIDRPGYPVVTGDDDFCEYTQRRFLLDAEMPEEEWPLVSIDEDMSGHYILNLSEAEFDERLARFDEMGLEEKLRLLIDRSLICRTRLAPSRTLMPLVWKFREETSAAVWDIIVTIVAGLKIFFEYESGEEKEFKRWVSELVKPGLTRVGLKTRADDDENTLRLRALLVALDFYAETEGNLKALAEAYSRDYAALDKEMRGDILDAKIFLEPGMLDEYLAAYREVADPEIKYSLLFATTLIRDAERLSRLAELLEQPEVVKPQDQFYLFIYLYRNPVAREMVFSWLCGHWEYVKEISGDKSLDNYPRYIAGAVRTEAEFKAWREFFEPMADDPALARAIEMGANEIRARLKLIAEDGDGVREELKKMQK